MGWFLAGELAHPVLFRPRSCSSRPGFGPGYGHVLEHLQPLGRHGFFRPTLRPECRVSRSMSHALSIAAQRDDHLAKPQHDAEALRRRLRELEDGP